MTKKIYIVFLALGLASCASQAPLDDAYHWEDKTPSKYTPQPTQATPTTPTTQSTQATQTTEPTLHFLNIQDTTVTVRIKK